MPLLEPIFAALVTFVAVLAILRAVEWLYHRLRRTPDWSAHWGSWVFAVLAALLVLIEELGR